MTEMALVLLAARDRPLGEMLREGLSLPQLHMARHDAEAGDIAYASVADHLVECFGRGQPIIFIGSSGIVMRALSGQLKSKYEEPPVIAVSADGLSVVPLLGGHRGGNQLAEKIASITSGKAVITTSGDLLGLPILDQPARGYTCADKVKAQPFMQRLLNGETLSCALEEHADMPDWLKHAQIQPATAQVDMRVSIHTPEQPDELTFHPRRLVVGVGCERFVDPGVLQHLVEKVLSEHRIAPDSIACVTSHVLKSAEPAVHALAARLDVPARFFSGEALLAETDRLSVRSDVVFKETGCYGVSEAAALAAVGANGALLVNKVVGDGVTCAIAEAPEPVDADVVGHKRGRLSVIGIGPGRADWRTPDASHQIRQSDDLVGYSYYLDLIEPLGAHQHRHDYALGEERKRCAAAIELAATGRNVAMICSGDAGIYAMASLVLEVFESCEDIAEQRIELDFVPGVTAMQAASARVGAVLGHDFCAISLSDLMTPWAVIENRIRSAGQGDFVVALYNPASKTRRQGLSIALDILKQHRPPETPVILGRMLGRPEETLTLTTISELDPDIVDMMTVVMIGSSQTRLVDHGLGTRFVFTPRGYEVS